MKPYRALILDYDMTIADTGPLILDCWRRAAGERQIPFDPSVYKRSIGQLPRTTVDTVVPTLSADERERFLAAYIRLRDALTIENTRYFPGVAEGVAALDRAGVMCAVLSLKPRRLMEEPMRRAGIFPHMRAVFGYDECQARKPDPEGLLRLAEKLDVPLADILYVGDSLTDQGTAVNAGTDFAPMLLGNTPLSAFAPGYVACYRDFTSLARDILTARACTMEDKSCR